MTNPIETLRPDSAEKKALACRLNIERALERLHLDSKIVWLYLLRQVRYLDREEVVALGNRLTRHYENHGHYESPGERKSLYEFITDEPGQNERVEDKEAIAELSKRIPKNDLFLNHVSLIYDPPTKPFDVTPQQNVDKEGRKFMRVVDVLAEGSKLLKDLYSLEALAEINVRRALSQTEDRIWEERFTFSEMGKQHAWVIDLLVQDTLNSHLRKDGYIILVDRYRNRVVPTPSPLAP